MYDLVLVLLYFARYSSLGFLAPLIVEDSATMFTLQHIVLAAGFKATGLKWWIKEMVGNAAAGSLN